MLMIDPTHDESINQSFNQSGTLDRRRQPVTEDVVQLGEQLGHLHIRSVGL